MSHPYKPPDWLVLQRRQTAALESIAQSLAQLADSARTPDQRDADEEWRRFFAAHSPARPAS